MESWLNLYLAPIKTKFDIFHNITYYFNLGYSPVKKGYLLKKKSGLQMILLEKGGDYLA